MAFNAFRVIATHNYIPENISSNLKSLFNAYYKDCWIIPIDMKSKFELLMGKEKTAYHLEDVDEPFFDLTPEEQKRQRLFDFKVRIEKQALSLARKLQLYLEDYLNIWGKVLTIKDLEKGIPSSSNHVETEHLGIIYECFQEFDTERRKAGGIQRKISPQKPEFPAVGPYPVIGYQTFCERPIEPLSWAVDGLLLRGSINMIFSMAGLGKSRFCEELAFRSAMGYEFLAYKPTVPLRSVHIHGEMLDAEIKSRLDGLKERWHPWVPANDMFSVLSYQHVAELGLPPIDLYDPTHQIALNPIMQAHDLIILDNLLTLTGDGDGDDFANKAASWMKIVSWLKFWSSKGKTILIVHHANKSNESVGTSRMNVELGTKIKLVPYTGPATDYILAFDVQIEKGRNLQPKEKAILQAALVFKDGKYRWTRKRKTENEEKE